VEVVRGVIIGWLVFWSGVFLAFGFWLPAGVLGGMAVFVWADK
jgi:hypothetical protein